METEGSIDICNTDMSSYEGSVEILSTGTFCLHIITLILGGAAIITNGFFLRIISKIPSLRKMSLLVYLINISCINICLAVGYIIVVGFRLSSPDMNVAAFILSIAFLRYPFQEISTVLTACIAWERYKLVVRPFQTMASTPHLTRHCFGIVGWTAMMLTVFVILNMWWFTKGLIVFPIVSLVTVTFIDLSTLILSVSLYYPTVKKLQEDPNLGQRSGVFKRQQQFRLLVAVAIDTSVYFILVLLLNVILLLILCFCLKLELLQHIFEVQAFCFLLHSNIAPIVNTMFGYLYRKAFLEMCSPFVRRVDPVKLHVNKLSEKAGSHLFSESTV